MGNDFNFETLAYVIGVAIGDGNLSNPRGKALRLRVTCDTRYPRLIEKISQSIKVILPKNKVSITKREETYIDISCYSNQWNKWLPWTNEKGPKSEQAIHIPSWIRDDRDFSLACLRGLIETDGSLYYDRGYLMINFTSVIETLSHDVVSLITDIGFFPKTYLIQTGHKPKYVTRLARDVRRFIELVKIDKS